MKDSCSSIRHILMFKPNLVAYRCRLCYYFGDTETVRSKVILFSFQGYSCLRLILALALCARSNQLFQDD